MEPTAVVATHASPATSASVADGSLASPSGLGVLLGRLGCIGVQPGNLGDQFGDLAVHLGSLAVQLGDLGVQLGDLGVQLGAFERTTLISAVVAVLVTVSLPLFLKGAWIVIDADVVTWSILLRHLRYVGAGLVFTTAPMLVWMVPRFLRGLTGLRAVHAFFGLQAYALLAFGLTGIYHILRAKRAHSLYEEPGQDVALSDLHEKADAWRFRLRVGVFGYLLCWIVAYLLGLLLLAVRLVNLP